MKTIKKVKFGKGNPVQLLREIYEHEKMYRNVDWEKDFFNENGEPRKNFVNEVIHKSILEYKDVLPSDEYNTLLSTYTSSTPDDAKLLDLFCFEPKDFKTISKLKGKEIEVYILQIIKNLQQIEKEFKSGTFNWELIRDLFAGVGLIVSGVKFILAIKVAMEGGTPFLIAFASAITAAGAIAIAALIVIVVAFLLIMLKEAREFLLIINNTDYDLRITDMYRHHGKVEFLPGDEFRNPVINGRMLHDKKPTIFGGLVGLRKKESAFYGAEGVMKLDAHIGDKKHLQSSYLGYVIPLTFLGGDNGGYAKWSDSYSSSMDFFGKNEKQIESGLLESTDTCNNVKLTKRINSKSGSEVFSIATYEQ